MIGISIGTSSTSIAKTFINENNKCKYSVILSETSQRTIPSIISYSNNHRLIGEEALLVIGRNISRSCNNIIRLVGLEPKSPFGKRENELFSVVGMDFNQETNSYQVSFAGNAFNLSNEAILSGFINKLKQVYINKNNLQSEKVVFSYPDYFNSSQYFSFTSAVNACNIKDPILIPESIALSHYYGYNKWKDLFPSLENMEKSQMTKDQFVIFVDVGEAKTSFILTQYTDKTYKVTHQKSIPFFGGRDLDEALFCHCAILFENKHNVDITKSRKAKYKLLEAIKKARKILTVNKDAHILIDSLYEDYDFDCIITREEFEIIIEYNLKMFSEQFDAFYREALWFVQDSDIYGIEMAGDLMRTPCLQAVIKEITGKEISKCVLTDECLSVGCALYGEMIVQNKLLQKVFSHVHSLVQYSIYCLVNGQKREIISKGLPLPTDRFITLSNCEFIQNQIISLEFYYENQEINSYSTSNGLISEYKVNPDEIFKANKQLDKTKSDTIIDVVIGINISATIEGFYLRSKGQILNYNQMMITQVNSGMQKKYSEMNKTISELRDIEDRCMKIDTKYLQFYSDKNILEGKCYQLKNKIYEKHFENKEYKERSVISWIDKITDDIANLIEPNEFLAEIESMMNEISNFLFSNGNAKVDKKFILMKIEKYENALSEELMKLLSKMKAKYNERKIDQLAKKLTEIKTQVFASNDDQLLIELNSDIDKEFN